MEVDKQSVALFGHELGHALAMSAENPGGASVIPISWNTEEAMAGEIGFVTRSFSVACGPVFHGMLLAKDKLQMAGVLLKAPDAALRLAEIYSPESEGDAQVLNNFMGNPIAKKQLYRDIRAAALFFVSLDNDFTITRCAEQMAEFSGDDSGVWLFNCKEMAGGLHERMVLCKQQVDASEKLFAHGATCEGLLQMVTGDDIPVKPESSTLFESMEWHAIARTELSHLFTGDERSVAVA